MPDEINIPITIAGITFKNPFFVASGPTTKNIKQLRRIEETGWAGASLKLSIDPVPYINRKPRYGMFKDRNALAFTAEKRLTMDQGLRLMSEAKKELRDLKLMANITYAGEEGVEGWVNMAKRFEAAGADIIELNMCCPNMSYNLELTSGGSQTAPKQTGASMGQNGDISAEIVRAIKENIKIPLFAKLTPEGGKIASVAQLLFAAGADAVGGTGNRMGLPPINLDQPEKSFYHLQDEISMSCHCGAWLKPLAQRDTYEIRKVCGPDAMITATGGITNWRDAVEMTLCGGNLLGICAETLINGYDIVRPMIAGMQQYMDDHGYKSTADFRSLIVDKVKTATEVTLHNGYAKIKNPNLSAPCKAACPHHVPVQDYIQKVAKGDFVAAYNAITSKGPLQSICSLVCTHPCEDACVRGKAGRPVEIREIKRSVFEYAKEHGLKPSYKIAPKNGHRVAVVGSGPSGLSCAAALSTAGYDVTIFEKEKVLGGAMRLGIPSYRLENGALDSELSEIMALGVEVVTEKEFGTDFTKQSLIDQGFEKLFLACGALPEKLEYGWELRDFMKTVACNKSSVSGSAAIIGKTYIAIDAAISAKRLGCEPTYLIFDKLSGAKKQLAEQLSIARSEGVKILENTSVSKLGNPIELCNTAELKFELSVSNTVIEGNCVSEFKPEPKTLDMGDGFTFVGGDAVKIGNVISAISAGKRAAAAIDIALQGEKALLKLPTSAPVVQVEAVLRRSGFLKDAITKKELHIKDGKAFFPALSLDDAVAEAKRCLNCGCGEGCQLCKTICTDFAPFIESEDKLCIDKDSCVACGMCYNRCPNNNIEMINTDEKQ
ncbi:MAG: FAD-dependent oxidoreductase [Oscillospiraceae bacterium]